MGSGPSGTTAAMLRHSYSARHSRSRASLAGWTERRPRARHRSRTPGWRTARIRSKSSPPTCWGSPIPRPLRGRGPSTSRCRPTRRRRGRASRRVRAGPRAAPRRRSGSPRARPVRRSTAASTEPRGPRAPRRSPIPGWRTGRTRSRSLRPTLPGTRTRRRLRGRGRSTRRPRRIRRRRRRVSRRVRAGPRCSTSASFAFSSSETGSTFELSSGRSRVGLVHLAEVVFRAGGRVAHVRGRRDGRSR